MNGFGGRSQNAKVLIVLVSLMAMVAPGAQGEGEPEEPGGAGDALDLGRTVDAGEYLAYRVELPSGGGVYVGGKYNDVYTHMNVLPFTNIINDYGSAWAATTSYIYDDFRDDVLGFETMLSNDTLGDHHVHTHEKVINDPVFRGITFFLPPGTYDIVSLTAPATGTAEVFLEVPDDSRVIQEETGDVDTARGVEASTLGYEIRGNLRCVAHSCIPDQVHDRDYHEWYYSGAEVNKTVEGSLYGSFIFAGDTEAHWQTPSGPSDEHWIIGGEPGEWGMSFPEERYVKRNCVEGVCTGSGSPYRLYPPFAMTVDLGF